LLALYAVSSVAGVAGLDCRPLAWSVPVILALGLVHNARAQSASNRARRTPE
jgi:hypothetical protein